MSDGITVLCAGCRLLVGVQGVPYTEAHIFDAAESIGWTVVGRQCFCPTCKPTDGKVRCVACKGAGKLRVALTKEQATALGVVATAGVVVDCEPCEGSGRVFREVG